MSSCTSLTKQEGSKATTQVMPDMQLMDVLRPEHTRAAHRIRSAAPGAFRSSSRANLAITCASGPLDACGKTADVLRWACLGSLRTVVIRSDRLALHRQPLCVRCNSQARVSCLGRFPPSSLPTCDIRPPMQDLATILQWSNTFPIKTCCHLGRQHPLTATV